jgi:hypothetical protein
MDVAHVEMVEAELNRVIERRSSWEMDPYEREELWQKSMRAYTARRREEMRAAWASYHAGQVARHRHTLEGLITYHEKQAARFRED